MLGSGRTFHGFRENALEAGDATTMVPHVRAKLELKLVDFSLKATVPVPQGKTTVRYMLPLFRGLADAVVTGAARDSAAAGKPVSCRKGCSACCYQLVPVAEPEAFSIASLVQSMPEERRAHIQRRFAETKEKLRAAGLWDAIADVKTVGPEHFNLAITYLKASIPCPFLEDNACSIHADRPVSCREYMVSSDPKWCSDPLSGKMVPINVQASVGEAMALSVTPAGEQPRRVSLPMMLEYAAAHAEAPAEKTGPEVLQSVLGHLTGKKREITQAPPTPANQLSI